LTVPQEATEGALDKIILLLVSGVVGALPIGAKKDATAMAPATTIAVISTLAHAGVAAGTGGKTGC
jgi:hypothetical protein